MNFKKLLSVLAITAYAFTAQLGVHAFAMHGNSMGHHENTNQIEDNHGDELSSSHTHKPKKKDCGHPEPTHDHNSHLSPSQDGDHDKSAMMICLTQSEGTLISDDLPIKEIKVVGFIPPLPTYTITQALVEEKVLYTHDPGWGDDISFAQFLDIHYGSTVMHC